MVNWQKTVWHYFILLVSGAFVGVILLMMVYLLPEERMKDHAAESLDVFLNEGPSYKFLPDVVVTRLDNYSDALMINTAIYEGNENVLVKAMAANQYTYQTGTAFDATVRYLSNEKGEMTESYARYWHGYLVLLKPLLCIFNYKEIRLLNIFVQIFLTGWFVVLMIERGMKQYIKAFFACLFIIMPFTIFLCMHYLQVYFVTLLAMIFFLIYYEKICKREWLVEFYFVVGMLTCYFDLLTYPIIALGFVLLLQILLERNLVISYKKKIVKMFQSIFSWCIGYLGIWGAKWVLATVILRENIVKDAILSVLYRSSSESSDSGVIDEFSRWDALKRNLSLLNNKIFIAGMLLFVAAIFLQILRNKRVFINRGLIVQVIIVMALPVGWMLALANHSYVHYWMTYKNFAITFLGFGILLTACTEPYEKMR